MKVRKGTSKAPTKLVLHNIRTFRNNSEQVKKNHSTESKKQNTLLNLERSKEEDRKRKRNEGNNSTIFTGRVVVNNYINNSFCGYKTFPTRILLW